MAPPGTARAKELFLAALERPPGERPAFLREACDGDPGLRARIEELLAAHERAEEVERFAAADGEQPIALVGDYELLEEVASGAMGTVYRARQVNLDRIVALKVLRVGRFATEKEVRRFRAEAEAAARLDHPHIVPVYDVGEYERRNYFSMKLIDGPGLDACLERFAGDPEAAAAVVAKVAHAVHHAHLHGVLHRDLKPSNILLDADGEPHVADFGIAKRVGGAGDKTATGALVGTPQYMAPEQATHGGDVTTATDVYALGCILYELLTGAPPFTGDDVLDVLRMAREEEPPRMRGSTGRVRDLETICQKCLAKRPSRRYRSAHFLAEDLERWLAHLPIEARTPSVLERVRMLWRRKPVTSSLSAAVAILLVVLGVFAAVSNVTLRDRLRGSLLAQARANRRSLEPGRRHASLDLLEQAAAIRPGPDLRDEAITCLTVIDLQAEARCPLPEGSLLAGFDHAGARFAVPTPERELSVRTFPGNEELYRLPPTPASPWSAKFGPHGRFAVVRSHGRRYVDDPLVQVWDLDSREVVWERDAPSFARAVTFDPSGHVVALGAGDTLFLIDTRTWEEVLVPLREEPVAAAFHPGGDVLAVGTDGKELLLLRPSDGEELFAEELEDHVGDLSWSPDGSLLALASHDFNVHLIDPSSGAPHRLLAGHEAEVVEVEFATPGLLVSYSWDETTRVWDVTTGELVLRSEASLHALSANGRRLAFAQRGEVGVWRVEGGEAFRTFHGHEGKSPTRIAACPRRDRIATGGPDGTIVWELASGRRSGTLSSGDTKALFFGPEGETLYTCGELGLLAWPLPGAALGSGGAASAVARVLVEGPCGQGARNEDGSLFAVRKENQVILVSPDGRALRTLAGLPGMDNIAVDPTGELVAAGSWRGTGVRVWNARTGEVERDLLTDEGAVTIAFDTKGRLVAGTHREYRIWNVATWETERVVPRHAAATSLPGAIAFDAATGVLALQPARRSIAILDPDSGAVLARLEADVPWGVSNLAFLSGGGGLAAATLANRVQVWDLPLIRRELAARRLDHGLGDLWR